MTQIEKVEYVLKMRRKRPIVLYDRFSLT